MTVETPPEPLAHDSDRDATVEDSLTFDDPPTVPPLAGAPVGRSRVSGPGGTPRFRRGDEPNTLARLLTAG
jgi:hypothetical protein